MIDASIYQNIRPVQPISPLESYGKVLALRNAQQVGQMNAERLRSEQLANQQSQRKVQDMEGLKRAYIEKGGDPVATRQRALELGVGPETIDSFDKQVADIAAKTAETSAKELDTKLKRNTAILDVHDAALPVAQNNPQQFAQQWAMPGGFFDQASQIDPETAKHFTRETPPTVDQITASRAVHVTNEYTLKQAAEKRAQEDEQRKQAAAKREEELQPFKVQEATAKADQDTRANDAAVIAAAARRGPQELSNALRELQATAPARAAAFHGITAQSKPEDILAIGMTAPQQSTAANEAASLKQRTENEAALRRIAEGNLKVSQAHLGVAQKIYEQTYGQGANPALAGVEPKLRTQAASAAQKAADEFTKASESLNNVQSFIDMARKGNKAAGSNLPIMGAESIQALNGIKRINRTDIEQYQGAGSLLDSIQGKLGKIVSGQPIPADVMKDIEALHKKIGENAAATYNRKVESINQNYHANFKPVEHKQTAAKMIRARDPQGVLHEAPEGTPLPQGWKLEN